MQYEVTQEIKIVTGYCTHAIKSLGKNGNTLSHPSPFSPYSNLKTVSRYAQYTRV